MWADLLRLFVVCSCFALALVWIEALIRYRRDYLAWNCGICLETGSEWKVHRRSDGKVVLISGPVRRTMNGWILPFEQEGV